MAVDAAEGLQERRKTVEGHEVRVVSYKIGNRFGSRVDNINPGDVIGRGRGATREEAENAALEAASLRLSLSSAREMLQKKCWPPQRRRTPMTHADWFTAKEWTSTQETLAGWPVTIMAYRLRDLWICKVDNVSPGAVIARASGATLEEARGAATKLAESRLRKTRRTPGG